MKSWSNQISGTLINMTSAPMINHLQQKSVQNPFDGCTGFEYNAGTKWLGARAHLSWANRCMARHAIKMWLSGSFINNNVYENLTTNVDIKSILPIIWTWEKDLQGLNCSRSCSFPYCSISLPYAYSRQGTIYLHKTSPVLQPNCRWH